MKKSAMKFAAALGFVVAAGTAVMAAPTATVNITLTMADLNVENVGGASLAFSGGPASVIVASTDTGRAIFRNTGASNETFELNCNVGQNPWYLVTGTGALTPDQYRLSAIWHEWNVQPVAGDFGMNDILTNSAVPSDASAFFKDGDTNVGAVGGINVPPGAANDRNLFLKIELPLAGGSGKATETNVITVTAIVPL